MQVEAFEKFEVVADHILGTFRFWYGDIHIGKLRTGGDEFRRRGMRRHPTYL